MSVKVKAPSTLASRSSLWVSRRASMPTAMPADPAGRSNKSPRDSLKSAIVRVVRERRRMSKTTASIAARELGEQSP
ncbi:hypothetical protein D3C75_1333690 [compost metagenome]